MGVAGGLVGIAAAKVFGLTGIGIEFAGGDDGIGVGTAVVFGGCGVGKVKGGLTRLGVVLGWFWTGFGVGFGASGLSIRGV
jgi:hypothetical protein